MTTIDAEVLELLRTRPELLRVADAVSHAGRSAPRRRRITAAVLAVAVATGIALVATWPRGGPGVVDRALAAIGGGPVLHAVVAYSSPTDVVVDLATGKSRARVHTTEYWYDRERSMLHTRLLTDGKMLTEIVETPTGSDSDLGHYPGGFAAQLDPALAGFVTHYRDALANGAAQIVGHEPGVTILRFSTGHGATEDVAVDNDSYQPLFFTYHHQGQVGPTWHVRSIESTARNPADFAKPPRSAPRPTGGGESPAQEISLAQTSTALEHPPAWVGTSFDGLPLEHIALSTDTAEYTDGTTHEGKRLVLQYGKDDALVIGEAATTAGSYQLGFNDGGDPPAPEGSIALQSDRGLVLPGAAGPTVWTGKLVRGDLYVQLRATSRDLVLAAARALQPIP